MPARLYPHPIRKHIFVPDGSLDAWQAAKATAGSSQVPVVVVGDSIAQGIAASDFRTQSWAGLLGAWLATLSPGGVLAGEFFGVTESLALGTTSVPVANRYWSLGGTWAIAGSLQGLFGFSGTGTGGVGDTATFTPPAGYPAFPDFDICLHQQSTGTTFTLTRDSVAKTADGGVGLQTYLNAAYARHVQVAFTGAGGGSNVIALTPAGQPSYLSGIMCYPTGRTASGFSYIRHNMQGKNSQIWKQFRPLSTPTYDGAAATITDWNPKLVIIALGVNDPGAVNAGFARYAQGRAAQAAQNAGASIIFLIPYGGSGLTNPDAYPMYMEGVRLAAQNFNACVIDVHSAWGSNPGAAGLLSGDNIHPTNAGHIDIYNRLLQVL